MTYLDTNEMRDRLRANPHWSRQEALENLLGLPPTERQKRMAERSDGRADDERVKWSIPDQIDRWKLFYERDIAPGFVLTVAQVHPHIQIDPFDEQKDGRGQALIFTLAYARQKLLPRDVTVEEWLETAQVSDYWDDLYQRTHGRDADAKGKAFWVSWLEMEFVKGMKEEEQVASARLTKSTKP